MHSRLCPQRCSSPSPLTSIRWPLQGPPPVPQILHYHWVNWQTTDHLSGPTEAGAYRQHRCLHPISTSISISASISASSCTSGCLDNTFWTPCPLARPTGLLTFCVCPCCMLYFVRPAHWGGVFVVCCIIYIIMHIPDFITISCNTLLYYHFLCA